MTRVLETVVVFVLVAVAASPLLAQEQKAGRKKQRGQAANVIAGPLAKQLQQANLTDEQKTKLEGIKSKYAGKVAETRKAINAMLNKELRQARAAAVAKAKEEGKKGAEVKAAGDAALNLNEEQKKSLADAEAKMKQIQTEIREEVLGVLTDEQKEALGLNKRQKAKKKAKNS